MLGPFLSRWMCSQRGSVRDNKETRVFLRFLRLSAQRTSFIGGLKPAPAAGGLMALKCHPTTKSAPMARYVFTLRTHMSGDGEAAAAAAAVCFSSASSPSPSPSRLSSGPPSPPAPSATVVSAPRPLPASLPSRNDTRELVDFRWLSCDDGSEGDLCVCVVLAGGDSCWSGGLVAVSCVVVSFMALSSRMAVTRWSKTD